MEPRRMENPETAVTTFRKGALTGVFLTSLKYLGLAVVLVFTARIIPPVKAATDIAFATPLWIIAVAVLGLIATGYTIAAYLFQKQILQLQAESEIDELTGFKNYKALNIELKRLEFSRIQAESPISLILLDIDNFKQLNDEYSYEAADKVLAELGAILRRDARITDEVYRYFLRGDEFLIIARNTTLENARLAADRKRRLIQEANISVNGIAFDLSVSCGITSFSADEHQSDVLLRLGKAIQAAKKMPGKSTTVVLARKEVKSEDASAL